MIDFYALGAQYFTAMLGSNHHEDLNQSYLSANAAFAKAEKDFHKSPIFSNCLRLNRKCTVAYITASKELSKRQALWNKLIEASMRKQ